jgi:quercetin dioxygenase-like cupin family protein
VVAQVALPVSPAAGNANLLGVVLDFAPGQGFPNHVHGGPVVVYVLSGAITVRDDSGAKTYSAGESWTEMPGHVHSALNEGGPARVALAAVVPEGADLTTVEAAMASPAGMPTTGGGTPGGSGLEWLAVALAAGLAALGLALRGASRRRSY